jgi:AcrR family transcriptional regulator
MVPSAERMSSIERRHAILVAAQPLFAARGLEGVTTREVAAAANVSEALLYRHFESKAALYTAVQESCVQIALADAQRIEALPDGTGTLVIAVYAVMRNIQMPRVTDGTEQEVPRLMLQSLLSDGDFARNFLNLVSGPWIGKMERCLMVAIESGDIKESAEAAKLGCWFAHHLAVSLVFFRLPESPALDYSGAAAETVFEQSVRFALRGLGLTPEAIDLHYQPKALAFLSR